MSITTSKENSESAITISLDIAELVAAFAWPLMFIVLILVLKKHLPQLMQGFGALFNKVEKLSFGDFSLDLSKASAMPTKWTSSYGAMGLHNNTMHSANINDSYVSEFMSQLNDTTPIEYAVIDLGSGNEWLTSRLFILAILLERSRNVQAFVFVRKSGDTNKKLIGWAEPTIIRWSLARIYPSLENAFAKSYSKLLTDPNNNNCQVVSSSGMLGYGVGSGSPHLLIELMKLFLNEIQVDQINIPAGEGGRDEWIQLQPSDDDPAQTWERAQWLNLDNVEAILGDKLHRRFCYSKDWDSMSTDLMQDSIAHYKQKYIPIVDESERFRELVNRDLFIQKILNSVDKILGRESV